ncbi:MAG: hypothetical protein F2814_03540 [Actinobacteria bacterium]|nr:hypothetical protein [Actinomycetota bacterium]
MRARNVAVVICVFLLFSCAEAHASSRKSISGPAGQVLAASKTLVTNGARVKVTGENFDETVGIYLGFCVVPKKGSAPTPCGGGINKSGIANASYWISSNPPPYGVGLALPFIAGGRFQATLTILRKIGKFDCAKVKCAITVRADHTRSDDRSFDLFIPMNFSKTPTK